MDFLKKKNSDNISKYPSGIITNLSREKYMNDYDIGWLITAPILLADLRAHVIAYARCQAAI